MKIDHSHPRAKSLAIREKLVKGVKMGITSTAGLLAHGRGEAFDYLLGEKTHIFSNQAITAAAATLLLSQHPVLSINGNCAALVNREFINLANLLSCKIEINLFHYTKEREKKIEKLLYHLDKNRILYSHLNRKIPLPNIKSHRRFMYVDGIAKSDVVFVPLEDGDRSQALINLGKKVVTVDLNPLSRTARCATITIVDNIVRTIPLLIKKVLELNKKSKQELLTLTKKYNNEKILKYAYQEIIQNLAHFKEKETML